MVILIVTLVVFAKVTEKIESLLKKEFTFTCEKVPCQTTDKDVVPTFLLPRRFNADLAQLYFYQDMCCRNNMKALLPLKLVGSIKYAGNNDTDPPICFVFEYGDTKYFISRGTLTSPELRMDEETSQIDFLNLGLAHKGFTETYVTIRAEIMKLIGRPKRLIIFGHSLGGAIVNLLCADLFLHGTDLNIIAFGSAPPNVFSPLLADKVTASEKAQSLTQVINTADIVPSIPLSVTDVKNATYYYKTLTYKRIVVNSVKHSLLYCHLTPAYSEKIYSNDYAIETKTPTK